MHRQTTTFLKKKGIEEIKAYWYQWDKYGEGIQNHILREMA